MFLRSKQGDILNVTLHKKRIALTQMREVGVKKKLDNKKNVSHSFSMTRLYGSRLTDRAVGPEAPGGRVLRVLRRAGLLCSASI